MPQTKESFEGLLTPYQTERIPEFCRKVTRIARILHGAREMGMDVPSFNMLRNSVGFTAKAHTAFPSVRVYANFKPYGVRIVTAIRYKAPAPTHHLNLPTPTHYFTLRMDRSSERLTKWDNLQPCQTVQYRNVASEIQHADHRYMRRACAAEEAWGDYLGRYLQAILGGYISLWYPGLRSEEGTLYMAYKTNGLQIARPNGQIIRIVRERPDDPYSHIA